MQFVDSGQRIAVENFVTGKLYNILFKNDTQVNITCTSIGADCVVFQGEAPLNLFTLTMQNADTIDTIEPTQLGTTNYNNLINKPSINGVDLIGNKTSSQLGIRDVPAIIEADDGKVLTAASDGSYSWQVIPEGTTDYTDLSNKPQINDVTLIGNVSLSDLGAAAASDIPTTPGDIGAEPAITSENKLDPALIAYDSTHAAITEAQVTQIGTNETNISLIDHASGTKLYFTETQPTGVIGDYWISSTNGVKVYGRTYQLFNKDATNPNNGYINNGYLLSTGEVSTNADYRVSEYIPCTAETTYTVVVGRTVTNPSICFYDENHTYISGTAYNMNNKLTVTAPVNAVYMRGSYHSTDGTTYMIYEGTETKSYIPYYDWI